MLISSYIIRSIVSKIFIFFWGYENMMVDAL